MKLLHILEAINKHISKSTFRVYVFLRQVRIGKENGYPTCCVIHFAWDIIHKRPPGTLRGGIHKPGAEMVYVPCIFHKWLKHPDWSPYFEEHRTQLKLFDILPTIKPNKTRWYGRHANIHVTPTRPYYLN